MANAKLGRKAAGSIVKLKVNGAAKEFIVVHQGKPSSLYDDSCKGTWLLMKDIYENRVWQSENINKYESSDIYSYLNGPFLGLLDSNIKDAIKQVKIPYRKNGGSGGADQSGANGLSCKVFLLSGYEVGWSSLGNRYFPQDGARLAYFEANTYTGNDTSANNKRIANLNGSASDWWLRSPLTYDNDRVWCVESSGSQGGGGASVSRGIRPALVLSQDMEVNSSGNVITPIGTQKTLVNGTAYEVTGGKCLVNGTAYSVKKGRTLIGGTGYDISFAPSYDPVFANNTWEQIIEACRNNAVPDAWKVADQKPMTINGVDYPIDIIGKNHDDYLDSSGKVPLTFQLHDCYGTRYEMTNSSSNAGGWADCIMRIRHLPDILSKMPTEVQNGIREVKKRTTLGSQSTALDATMDKLFLLSEIEIFGSVSGSTSGEGTQYDYYKAGNSKVKKFNGSAYYWWERSPNVFNSVYFCNVDKNGSADSSNPQTLYGVAFGFCF